MVTAPYNALTSHKFTPSFTPTNFITPPPLLPLTFHPKHHSHPYYTQEPLAVTVASYNALLAVYAVSKVLDEREGQVLQEMESKGLRWDSYTYTALMMGRGDRQEVRYFLQL